MDLHTEIDNQLGTHGDDSIYQKVRLLSYKERALFDELFRQAEAGKGFDLRAAAKTCGARVRRVEKAIPDLCRRLVIARNLCSMARSTARKADSPSY